MRNSMVKKTKKVGKLKVDRISYLPAHLIQLILMSLPIKEAGRTSVLSREWRHHWRNTTRLVFDVDFASLRYMRDSKLNVDDVIQRIQEALQVHDGPITEFELAICGLSPSGNIDHLMSHLSNKGISTLTLIFESRGHEKDISSSLFCAFQLNSLMLHRCRFTVPSWFEGFTRMTVLELSMVSLPDDFFRSFLTKCPLLEDLRVLFIEGPRTLEVVGVPRLKVFLCRAFDLENICCFKGTPLLSVVSVQVEMFGSFKIDASAVDMVPVFASLPALEQLGLSLECLKILAAGPVPDRLPTALYGLEVLDIRKCHDDGDDGVDDGYVHLVDDGYVDDDDDHLLKLKVLLCLIRSSPNLCKLTINMKNSGLDDLLFERERIQLDSESDGCDPEAGDGYCQRLSEVNIEECSGSQVELNLLRFVLANAPRLSRIVIEPERRLSCQECLKFLEKVRQSDRASKKAEIICVDSYNVTIFRMKLASC